MKVGDLSHSPYTLWRRSYVGSRFCLSALEKTPFPVTEIQPLFICRSASVLVAIQSEILRLNFDADVTSECPLDGEGWWPLAYVTYIEPQHYKVFLCWFPYC
jgi:hypothetical protein